MFSLLNLLQDDPKLYEGFCKISKKSFISSGAILFLTSRTCRFFLFTVTELSRSRSSEKLALFW